MELEPFVFRHEGRLVGMPPQARAREDGPEGTEEAGGPETAGADLLAGVNAFALRPLAPGEFAVFTLDLCHNQVDRHFSRFPDDELPRVSTLVPGRPLMERHDLRGTLPRGTFFRSRLHEDGGRISVRPDVYVLRTQENADFIRNIEGGVYRETSIGFSFRTPECSVCGRDLRTCDHVPGRTYSGAVCHYVLRGVLEVIEGSVVSSGSQGTGFVAQRAAGEPWEPRPAVGGPLPLADALDRARRAYHAPIELGTQGAWAHGAWADE